MALGSRANSNGETSLYCRLTYKQRQKRFMIGCTVPLNMWDQSKQRAKGKSSIVETVNQQINKVLQEIYMAEAFEVEDIIIKVQRREKSACRTLMQLYQYRFKHMKKLEGIDYKASSLQKFLEMATAVRHFFEGHVWNRDIALIMLILLIILSLLCKLTVS
jgi:integrase/recombinase XerD